MAGMIGGLYDFIVATFGWWNENFTTRVCSAGEMLAEKAKLVFKVNTGAAVLGLGYIVGLKYASIICAGSLAVWWIIIPGMSAIWGDSVLNAWNPEITSTVGMMSPEEIFKYYAKSIGIGGIAMAGVIGIIRSWGIIKSAVGLAAKEMGGKGNVEKNIIRTQRDLSMKIIAIGSIITLILIVLFFYFDVMQGNLVHTLVAIVLVAGVYYGSRQCNRHCRHKPGIGNDTDDIDSGFCSHGSRWIARSFGNGRCVSYGWCGMYGTIHGGRFYH